jgi:hypothetical protein
MPREGSGVGLTTSINDVDIFSAFTAKANKVVKAKIKREILLYLFIAAIK